jgi:hypothetical protein
MAKMTRDTRSRVEMREISILLETSYIKGFKQEEMRQPERGPRRCDR